MGIASNIISGLSAASTLDTQAKTARISGTAQKDAAYRNAAATEKSATAQAKLEARQMNQTRNNQSQAVGSARTQAAAKGFDMTSGSGGASETAVARAYEQQLENMSLSSAIGQNNAINSAYTMRQRGDLAAMSANLQADLLNQQAKTTRGSQWFTAAGSLVGSVAGYDRTGTGAGALAGANSYGSAANAFNPYTSQYTTKEWEDNFVSYFMSDPK